MHLLDLDEYSLRLILLQLDPIAQLNIMCTCKTLQRLSGSSFRPKSWMNDIQERLLQLITLTVDRDDYEKQKRQESVLLSALESLIHSIDMIHFIQNFDEHSSGMCGVLCQLLLDSAKSNDLYFTKILELVNSGYLSGCWYPFENVAGESVVVADSLNNFFLCFVREEKKPSIQPVGFARTSDRWNYVYWYKGEPRVYRNSYSHELQDVCTGFLEKLEGPHHADLTKTTLESLVSLTFPINDDKNSDIIKCEHAGDCAGLATLATEDTKSIVEHIQNVAKRALAESIHLSTSLIIRKSFTTLLRVVTAFCTYTDHSIKRNYLSNLKHYAQPFYLLFSRYGYGELLGYFPIVKVLASCLDIVSPLDISCGNGERPTITLHMRGLGLELRVQRLHGRYGYTVVRSGPLFKVVVEGEGKVVVDVVSNFSGQWKNEEEEEGVGELLQIFNLFVDRNLSEAELRSAPEISVTFLRHFFYDISF